MGVMQIPYSMLAASTLIILFVEMLNFLKKNSFERTILFKGN
jgi:hypothetical protein